MKRLLVVLALLLSMLSVGAVTSVSPAAADATTLILKSAVADNSKNATYLGTPGWTELVDGATSGHFEYTDQKVSGDYSWKVPDTIPSTGADLTVTSVAHDGSGYRMYAYIGVSDPNGHYIATKEGAVPKIEITAAADHNAGMDTATATKTVTLVPADPDPGCDCVKLNLKLGPEGPSMTYTYEVAGAHETQVAFQFKTTARPNAKRSTGDSGLFTIDAHGKGEGHLLGDLSSWLGIVHVAETRAKHGDNETTLREAKNGSAEYHPRTKPGGNEVVSMRLKVKESTLKGCHHGDQGHLGLADRDDPDSTDTLVIKYCGKELIWERKPGANFLVRINAE